jgi:hypothetical protein
LAKENIHGADNQLLYYIVDPDADDPDAEDAATGSLFKFFENLSPELQVDHARLITLQLLDGDNGTPAQRSLWWRMEAAIFQNQNLFPTPEMLKDIFEKKREAAVNHLNSEDVSILLQAIIHYWGLEAVDIEPGDNSLPPWTLKELADLREAFNLMSGSEQRLLRGLHVTKVPPDTNLEAHYLSASHTLSVYPPLWQMEIKEKNPESFRAGKTKSEWAVGVLVHELGHLVEAGNSLAIERKFIDSLFRVRTLNCRFIDEQVLAERCLDVKNAPYNVPWEELRRVRNFIGSHFWNEAEKATEANMALGKAGKGVFLDLYSVGTEMHEAEEAMKTIELERRKVLFDHDSDLEKTFRTPECWRCAGSPHFELSTTNSTYKVL